MPHGVLFRGGDEKEIRTGIIEDDRLEAVIGLAPNLFYGTGIPACILVLRGTAPRTPSGAARCCSSTPTASSPLAARRTTSVRSTSRRSSPPTTDTQTSRLRPRRGHRTNCAENDFNLNIRRYVDNAPPPEPQDVRAHLHGGVPETEVATHAGRFAAYGIDVAALFLLPNERLVTSISLPLAGRAR